MEQFTLAFINVVHLLRNLCDPPSSFLHTLATRLKTALPQFVYSIAASLKMKYTCLPSSKLLTKYGSEIIQNYNN